jgi:hypothetical protein
MACSGQCDRPGWDAVLNARAADLDRTRMRADHLAQKLKTTLQAVMVEASRLCETGAQAQTQSVEDAVTPIPCRRSAETKKGGHLSRAVLSYNRRYRRPANCGRVAKCVEADLIRCSCQPVCCDTQSAA